MLIHWLSTKVKKYHTGGKFLEWNKENLSSNCDSIFVLSPQSSSSVIMWGSEGDGGGSGDYEYVADEESSEESVTELPGMIVMIQIQARET